MAAGGAYRGSTGNGNFGYFSGGQQPGSTVLSSVSRIDYSNDTATATAKGNLSIAKNKHAGVSSRESGLGVDRFVINTPFAFGNNPTRSYPYAYFGSGNGNSVPSTTTTMDRIDYANDTATPLIRGSMGTSAPSATQSYGETGNTSYGYFVGGRLGSPTAAISTVSRLDYSNDNLSTSVRGPLSGARNYEVAAGNQNFGWVVGGQDPSNSSDVDRINYANDTTTASPRGTLSFASACKGGASNTDFGWFAGGFPGVTSIVDRIDFSNDTATASPKGPLSETKAGLAAAGTQNYGYFGGGTPGPKSTVDRIDYANDTATATAKGPLSLARHRVGATGNSSHGYWGGGFPGPKSTVDRIDYANDTATASAKSPLNAARNYL